MHLYRIGDRVRLTKLALSISYIASRYFYTSMYEGKTGTVLGYSDTGKIAIQFDDIVFNHKYKKSSHNTGCHGKGRKDYCWYIPEGTTFVELISENTTLVNPLDQELLLLL